MTLPAQNPSQAIIATAGQTVFPFTFRCDDSTLITVWSNDALLGGVAVALDADQDSSPGGTVTIPAATVGDIVVIERVSPQTQTLALTSYNPFPGLGVMAALDRMVELLQEFWSTLTRAARHSRKNAPSISTTDLPAPAPGYALGWVADGDQFKLDNVTLASVSGGAVANRTLVKNEVPTGAVNSINAAFTFAHSPFSGAYLDIYVNGRREPPGNYALVGAVATFTAGNIPQTGDVIYADYYW